MLTQTKRRILFWLLVVIFFGLVPPTIFYSLGYRLSPDFTLQKTGGLYVSAPFTASEIFIDGEFQKRTNLLQGGIFVQNLVPKKYDVLVAKEGYLSWSKELEVSSQLVTEARAFLLPQNPNASVLLRGSFSEFASSPFDSLILLKEEKRGKSILNWYLAENNEFLAPDSSYGELSFKESFEIIRWLPQGVIISLDLKPLRLSFDFSDRLWRAIPLDDENPEQTTEEKEKSKERLDSRSYSKLYLNEEENELRVKWLREEILPYYLEGADQIILTADDIRNFEFFPKRRDVALIAYQNGVWAAELDGRSGRIVQPLYKGRNPNFVILPTGEGVYILDEGTLIKALLSAR